MTAGHCLWNEQGPVESLLASFGSYEVNGQIYWAEHRWGKAVLMSRMNDPTGDFAFALLHTRDSAQNIPIKPFHWYDTPVQANVPLYITGYPSDLDQLCNEMYEGSKVVGWDLLSEAGRLKHGISTYAGMYPIPHLLSVAKI